MRGMNVLREAILDDRGFGIVEALLAITILVIGMVAVSGLSLATATERQISQAQSAQALAGQMVLEWTQIQGFAAASNGSDTVSIDGNDFIVTRTITTPHPKIKEVHATVASFGPIGPRTFTTRLYQPRPLPAPPSP